jgi:hypothetical protein
MLTLQRIWKQKERRKISVNNFRIIYIFKSIFKQMLLANPQNANTLYYFLLIDQNEKNTKPGTKTTHQNHLIFLT